MKRMLFNATQQEELRVAIVDGQKLIDIDIETSGREQHKSNIYKAVITRIEPSLEACFVNYGEDRHGFLPFKEVVRTLFKEGVDVRSTTIKSALSEGQEIMVQVEKEERGNKGAALTTFVSLAGRYLVLMPNNPRGGGVSRRVEGEERQELREAMDKLDLPPGMSVIARTAGIGRSVEELQWDLNYLMQLWRAIEGAGKGAPGAFLIYHESSLVIRAIRDYFQPDIGEILIDTDEIYEQAQQFMSHVMPDMVHRVKRYKDDVPLFSRFQIEHQIETAYSRNVPLPSGGSIVIDHTEALVSIDVNSARSTRGTDIETTAFNTNCEAAEEAARQLRLRDLGGLIVIDFIDMENAKNQREVENRLKDALRYDRARVQMGKISRFGLMELSRQRLRPSLSEGSHVTCPRCNGTGHIRDIDSSALQVLRIIQEESMKENSAAIHVQIPVDVAAFLLNEKRGEILKIESRHRVSIILIPNKNLETPHYKLERIKHDDPRLEENQVSYTLVDQPDTDADYSKRQKENVKPRQEAVVKSVPAGLPAPIVERKPAPATKAAPALIEKEEGFLSKLFGMFRSKPAPAPEVVEPPKEVRQQRNAERNGRGPRGRNRSRGGRGREENAALEVSAAETAPVTAAPARPPRQQQESGRPERQRNERRPAPAPAEKAEETLLKEGALVAGVAAAIPTVAAVKAVRSEASETEPKPEAVEGEQEQETRRRRRRGGRNRNRRDRDGSEQASSETVVEATDEIIARETTHAEQEPTIAPAKVQEPVSTPASAPLSETAPAVQKHAEPAPFCWTAPSLEVPAVEAQPVSEAPVAEETAPQAAHAPAEVVQQAEAVAPQPVAEQAVEAAAPVEQKEEPVAPAAEAPVAAVHVSEEATQPVVSEPVAEQQPAVAAPVPEQKPEAAAATPAPAPQKDLSEVLASAGLTMAATDPEKLRAAQEKIETVQPPARAVRERKRPPVLPDEPLIQVDTRHE